MKALPFFAVTAQQVTSRGAQVVKIEWKLNDSVTDGLFVQVHDADLTPAEAAVPLKSWPISAQGFQGFTQKELPLSKGCYICLSSTAATKTLALGANDKFDVLQVELFAMELGGLTAVSQAAGVSLVVWAHGAAPKRLVRARIVAGTLAAATYALVCAVNGSTRVIVDRKQITASVENYLDYGLGRDIEAVAADGTVCKGCSILLSTSPTEVVAASDNCDLYADYKA